MIEIAVFMVIVPILAFLVGPVIFIVLFGLSIWGIVELAAKYTRDGSSSGTSKDGSSSGTSTTTPEVAPLHPFNG